jgi:FHS family glucose/mannose:H+ symporter-like MFS transporter
MLYNKKIAFAAACSGMLIFGMTIVTLGSLANELKTKFELDNYDSGTLFSILPIGLIIGSLIFGPVCDRYGYKYLMFAAALGIFIGFEGIAYSHNINMLRAFIFLFGVSGGVINGATNSIVVDVSDEHKGPNLSILGVFFGLGALGMPLILGLLIHVVAPLQVLAGLGWVTLILGVIYLFTRFPPAKTNQGGIRIEWSRLLVPLLLLISFFLFFQSSLESIITNWTTIYIGSRELMSEGQALFALSFHMMGMVAMRILTGTMMRNVSQVTILWICMVLLITGVLLMQFGNDTISVTAGLFLSGAGLSGGFPVMLGFVGHHFTAISGTAISFVFVVALIGNMLINYVTGIIIQEYGVSNLVLICYAEIVVMALLFYFIMQKLNKK